MFGIGLCIKLLVSLAFMLGFRIVLSMDKLQVLLQRLQELNRLLVD
jgi:hypothetical protein